MASLRSTKMVTHCGWAPGQGSPGAASLRVFQSSILAPTPSTFLLSEGTSAALWKASCPEPLSVHLPSLTHLLCLNGEPLLAGTPVLAHPGITKEAPRSIKKKKQVKCLGEVSKTGREHKPPVSGVDLGEGKPNPEVGAEDVPHPASSPTQVLSPETTERGT